VTQKRLLVTGNTIGYWYICIVRGRAGLGLGPAGVGWCGDARGDWGLDRGLGWAGAVMKWDGLGLGPSWGGKWCWKKGQKK
jgi:hypothetical protein